MTIIICFVIIGLLFWLLTLAYGFLSTFFGSVLALHIFFHLSGFGMWFIIVYTFTEKELKEVHLKKRILILYALVYFIYFLCLFPYNLNQLTSMLSTFGQLQLVVLGLNGIIFILLKTKGKEVASFLFFYFPIVELIASLPSVLVIVLLSTMFS